jgi:alpha-glucoside transport system substrate-binding protein
VVENIVLRSQGPEFYDAWIAHEIPFDHPAIVEAIATLGRLVTTEGNLSTGPSTSAGRQYWESGYDLWLNDTTPCTLVPIGAAFLPGLFESDDNPLDKTVFRFPTIDPRFADSMVGGGVLAIAIEDRPEVREVMAAMASPEWLSDSVDHLSPTFLPANSRFDTSRFTDPSFERIAEWMSASIESDMYRFDASDLMPPEIGEDQGAFPNGMLRLFREGTPENVEQLSQEIATEIEAVWQALESGS